MFYLFTHKGRLSRKAAIDLYRQVVRQSRQPIFYAEFSVPDTSEGRLEMISLFGGLLVSRLCRDDMGQDGKRLAQAFFDVMFRSLDLSIREMGVGDLAVPRRIKKMMSNFKGRAFAYDEAVRSDVGEIVHALSRNLFHDVQDKPSPEKLEQLAKYVQLSVAELTKQNLPDFYQGKVYFPSIETLNTTTGSSYAA